MKLLEYKVRVGSQDADKMTALHHAGNHALCFIILLCLTADDFTHKRETAATQWLK